MNLIIILYTTSGLGFNSKTAVTRLFVRNNYLVCDISIVFIVPRIVKRQATRSKGVRLLTMSQKLKGKRVCIQAEARRRKEGLD